MATKEELQALAGQLAHPTGEQGVRIAKMMDETNGNMTRQAIMALGLTLEQRILEIGHGNAQHVSDLLNNHSIGHYTGLEISSCMQKEAIAINQQHIDTGRATFLHYDGQHFPIAQASMDAIFSVNTIYFWKEPASFLANLGNLLTNGGTLVVTFASRAFMEALPFTAFGFTLYEEADVLALADHSSFRHVRTECARETVTSKSGDTVEREYLSMVWQKIKKTTRL